MGRAALDQCTCGAWTPKERALAANHGLSAQTVGEMRVKLRIAERRGARPVYFIPDPFYPARRIEVALLKSAESGVTFAPNFAWWDQPTNEHLLKPEQRAVIRLGLEDLRTWARGDALPVSMGPHFVLGEPC
jgi:hypothetical protein